MRSICCMILAVQLLGFQVSFLLFALVPFLLVLVSMLASHLVLGANLCGTGLSHVLGSGLWKGPHLELWFVFFECFFRFSQMWLTPSCFSVQQSLASQSNYNCKSTIQIKLWQAVECLGCSSSFVLRLSGFLCVWLSHGGQRGWCWFSHMLAWIIQFGLPFSFSVLFLNFYLLVVGAFDSQGFWIGHPALGCNMDGMLVETQCGWLYSNLSHGLIPHHPCHQMHLDLHDTAYQFFGKPLYCWQCQIRELWTILGTSL